MGLYGVEGVGDQREGNFSLPDTNSRESAKNLTEHRKLFNFVRDSKNATLPLSTMGLLAQLLMAEK